MTTDTSEKGLETLIMRHMTGRDAPRREVLVFRRCWCGAVRIWRFAVSR